MLNNTFISFQCLSKGRFASSPVSCRYFYLGFRLWFLIDWVNRRDVNKHIKPFVRELVPLMLDLCSSYAWSLFLVCLISITGSPKYPKRKAARCLRMYAASLSSDDIDPGKLICWGIWGVNCFIQQSSISWTKAEAFQETFILAACLLFLIFFFPSTNQYHKKARQGLGLLGLGLFFSARGIWR